MLPLYGRIFDKVPGPELSPYRYDRSFTLTWARSLKFFSWNFYFLAFPLNQVFTREQFLDHIWGLAEYIGTPAP